MEKSPLDKIEFLGWIGAGIFTAIVAVWGWTRARAAAPPAEKTPPAPPEDPFADNIAYNMVEGQKALDHGHYSDALPFFEQARELQAQAGYRFTDRRMTDTELYIIKTLFHMQNGLIAIDRGQKLIQLCQNELGEEHPYTLIIRDSVAEGLFIIGSTNSHNLHISNVNCANKRNGMSIMLVCSSNAFIYLNTINNNLKMATSIYRGTLAIRERTLGEEHPDTLANCNNLAAALKAMGDAKGAAEIHRKTLDICERTLGKEHSNTLTSRSNLALALRAMADAKRAVEMHQEIFTTLEYTPGKKHPDMLMARSNLATTLKAMGDAKGTAEIYRQNLAIEESALGEDHPHTLISRNNLAATLKTMGAAKEAAEMHRDTLTIRERALGREHPNTLGSRWNLANTLDEMGETEEADTLFNGLVEAAERGFGHDHFKTKIIRDYIMQR